MKRQEDRRVIVGIGAIVIREGKALVGLRQGSHGAGLWAFPGGHQDHGESWEECGAREVLDESGMVVRFRYFDPDRLQKFLCVTDDMMEKDDKHYNTVYVVYDWVSGEPEIREPDKCGGWEWVTFTELIAKMPPEAQESYRKFGSSCEYVTDHWFPVPHLARNLARIGLKYH